MVDIIFTCQLFIYSSVKVFIIGLFPISQRNQQGEGGLKLFTKEQACTLGLQTKRLGLLIFFL